jgi:hypothetical protein
MPSKDVNLSLSDHLIVFLEDKNTLKEVERLFKEG